MNGDSRKSRHSSVYPASSLFDTYIYTKDSDAGDNFITPFNKSDVRRSYIQRIVVPLPNNWKKGEQKFGNIA